MRTVELLPGIKSSALGFGCAPILGAVDAAKAKRALDCALDCGINHFDLARSYGYGEAERFVGKVLKDKRHEVVIASKFGIKANWKAKLASPVKPIVRFAIKMLEDKPAVNISAPKTSVFGNLHNRIPLRGKEMRVSLESSLSALKTDYLDYFFVHEPPAALLYIDELTDMVARLKDEGKIRGFGLAYMRTDLQLHSFYLNKFDVLQFDNSPGTSGYEASVIKRGIMPNIIFSPISGNKQMKPAEKLTQLFNDFPNSVILCSMFSEQHLIENAALLSHQSIPVL